jgi:membrane protein DedA with SNARE-associated domain
VRQIDRHQLAWRFLAHTRFVTETTSTMPCPVGQQSYVCRVGQLRIHLLLALSVTVGSALPFVPTGEMVSGAAAVASHSKLNVVLIFLITWFCSVLGDTLMLMEARLGARKLRPWIAKRKFAGRVDQAQQGLTKNWFNAVVTGRLIPGGRTPVIVALGLSRFSIRRFVLADLVACGLWAGIYSSLGSIGGRIAHHPIWAMVIAIAFATSIGVLVGKIRSVLAWRRERQAARV